MLRSAQGVLLAAFVALGGAAPAAAQEGTPRAEDLSEARDAFEAGRAAYEDGRFEDALVQFRRAHELTGNPDILYNVATVADRLRRDRLALEAYEGFIQARPDSEDRAHIEGRIRVLRGQLEREEELTEREREQREEQERLEEQLRESELEAEHARATRPDEGPGILPWIVAGSGVVLAGAGTVMMLVAAGDVACVEQPQDCVDDPTMPRWSEVESRNDRAPALSTAGAVLLGVGVAAMGVGLVWALTAGGGGEDVEVAVGPGNVSLRGSF